jgi:type 1 glutamine amidotransferase
MTKSNEATSDHTEQCGRQFRVLLFTKTSEWHHESILDGVTAMRAMAEKHYFNIDWKVDSSVFSDAELSNYDVVMFLSTTGNILNAKQQTSLKKFIQAGNGFVGIHSAADTEKDWPWYQQLVGRTFTIHPPIQTAKLSVCQRNFPGLELAPNDFLWTDEWYDFGPENTLGLNYLLTVDESTYNVNSDWGHKKGAGMGSFHPIAWFHEFDGGRSFYSALGHLPAIYENELFLNHVFGGLYWAALGINST